MSAILGSERERLLAAGRFVVLPYFGPGAAPLRMGLAPQGHPIGIGCRQLVPLPVGPASHGARFLHKRHAFIRQRVA